MSAVDSTIKKIIELLEQLDENQLLYILTFMQKMFGSR